MENLQLQINDKGFGHFYVIEDNEKLGEMEISISGADLTMPKLLRKQKVKDTQKCC
jgi:hypothetical protein